MPFVDGNDVELLENGPATYAAMETAIGGAERQIDMETYEFDPVEGAKFAELLIAKRSQGVEVHLVYDAWGSATTPASLFERLRRNGVRVLEFNPLRPNSRVPLDLNRRDHRKLLVVDGSLVITGGVNINAVYANAPHGLTKGAFKMVWRDTDVRIQGPVAAQFQALFSQTWHDQHGPPISPPPPTPATRFGDSIVQAVDGAPTDKQPLIYRVLLSTLMLSRTSVHLTTGFFVPTPQLAHALERAARRGVDVALVVPSHSTSLVAIEAGRAYYEDLMDAGVRIYERQDVVLHAKSAVIDGDWSTVGSSNLDWRSVLFNNEINTVVLGTAFGRQMEAMFQQDVAGSRQIDPAVWARRPLTERLREWGSRLVEYVL